MVSVVGRSFGVVLDEKSLLSAVVREAGSEAGE